MFCTKCGTQLQEDAVFCSKCGARVGKVPQENNVQQTNITQQTKNTPAAPKRGKKLPLLIGLVSVCLVLGIVVGLIFLRGGDESSQGETSTRSDKKSEQSQSRDTTSSQAESVDESAGSKSSEAAEQLKGFVMSADTNWNIYELVYATFPTIELEIVKEMASEGKIDSSVIDETVASGKDYIVNLDIPKEEESFASMYYGVWTSTDGLFEQMQSDHPEMKLVPDSTLGLFRGLNLGTSRDFGLAGFSYVTAENWEYTGEIVPLYKRMSLSVGNKEIKSYYFELDQIDNDTLRLGDVELDYLFDYTNHIMYVTYNGKNYTMVPAYLAYCGENSSFTASNFNSLASGSFQYNSDFIKYLENNLGEITALHVYSNSPGRMSFKAGGSVNLWWSDPSLKNVWLSQSAGITVSQTGEQTLTFSKSGRSLDLNFKITDEGVTIGSYLLKAYNE